MKIKSAPIAIASSLLAAALLSSTAQAASFSAIYAFGDSLSDSGNVFTLTSSPLGQALGLPVTPVAPYFNGQFSNGNVWLQTLATRAGLPALTPSLLGGFNFAYGGAESGTTAYHTFNTTDLWGTGGQIDQFKAMHPVADPNALYTVWIGANDLNDIPATATNTQALQAGAQTIANIDSAIGALAAVGARNFLVVTVPDLGTTPAALSAGTVAAGFATQASLAFNDALVNGFAPFGLPSLAAIASTAGLHISVLDTFAITDAIVKKPGDFGFSNATDACFTGTEEGGLASGTLCSSTLAGQNKYLYWDSLHPTAAAHALIGDTAANVLAVPEPETYALMLAGLGVIGFATRRRNA